MRKTQIGTNATARNGVCGVCSNVLQQFFAKTKTQKNKHKVANAIQANIPFCSYLDRIDITQRPNIIKLRMNKKLK